jgi:hypothetical protein
VEDQAADADLRHVLLGRRPDAVVGGVGRQVHDVALDAQGIEGHQRLAVAVEAQQVLPGRGPDAAAAVGRQADDVADVQLQLSSAGGGKAQQLVPGGHPEGAAAAVDGHRPGTGAGDGKGVDEAAGGVERDHAVAGGHPHRTGLRVDRQVAYRRAEGAASGRQAVAVEAVERVAGADPHRAAEGRHRGRRPGNDAGGDVHQRQSGEVQGPQVAVAEQPHPAFELVHRQRADGAAVHGGRQGRGARSVELQRASGAPDPQGVEVDRVGSSRPLGVGELEPGRCEQAHGDESDGGAKHGGSPSPVPCCCAPIPPLPCRRPRRSAP